MNTTKKYLRRISQVQTWLAEAGWTAEQSAFDYSAVIKKARAWYPTQPKRADGIVAKAAMRLRGEAAQVKGGRPPKNIRIGRGFKIRADNKVLIHSEFPDGRTPSRLAVVSLSGNSRNRIIRLACDDGETIVVSMYQ